MKKMEEPQYNFRYPIMVEYRDLDTNNHVNNAVFLSYLESARIAYNRDILSFSPRDRVGMVVANTEINYRKPGFYRQKLLVLYRVVWLKRSSFGWDYRIVLEEQPEVILADGKGVSVFMTPKLDQSMPIPPEFIAKFEDYEGRNLRTA
jgi:acyl-CoA thioester hydrolase